MPPPRVALQNVCFFCGIERRVSRDEMAKYFLALLLATASARAFNIFYGDAPSKVAMREEHDVIYSGPGGDTNLTMDIYFPSMTNSPPRPVVMYVHGGGWRMGDKDMLSIMAGPAELLRRGYVVVSINYRLAPAFKFPTMLEDAKCAVRLPPRTRASGLWPGCRAFRRDGRQRGRPSGIVARPDGPARAKVSRPGLDE